MFFQVSLHSFLIFFGRGVVYHVPNYTSNTLSLFYCVFSIVRESGELQKLKYDTVPRFQQLPPQGFMLYVRLLALNWFVGS